MPAKTEIVDFFARQTGANGKFSQSKHSCHL